MTYPAGTLEAALREIDEFAARAGWDQPATLFALVDTQDLVARQPQLAATLDGGPLTPVSQELASTEDVEQMLATVGWPADVAGCAVAMERLVLPPEAEQDLPDQAELALSAALAHPDRQEVRIVAGAIRTGETYCLVRMRAHDHAESVLAGAAIVPDLVQLLLATLEEDQLSE
jgi:hypothetical protein